MGANLDHLPLQRPLWIERGMKFVNSSKPGDWRDHIALYEKTYNTDTIRSGTYLYHASALMNPLKTMDGIAFFGLDYWISTWYANEMDTRQKALNNSLTKELKNMCVCKNAPYDQDVKYFTDMVDQSTIKLNNPYYYLNIYKLKEDIKCVRIFDVFNEYDGSPSEYMGGDNKSDERCEKNPCLHPQFAYHSQKLTLEPPCELSIELTLPPSYFKKLEFCGGYIIDTTILGANEKSTSENFDPIKSLVASFSVANTPATSNTSSANRDRDRI